MIMVILERVIEVGLNVMSWYVERSRKKEMIELFTKLCVVYQLPLPEFVFDNELRMFTLDGVVPIMGYTSFEHGTVSFNLKHIDACDATKDYRIDDIYDYTVRHELRRWWQIHRLDKVLCTNLYAYGALEQDAEAFGIGIVQTGSVVENNIKMTIGRAI